jgi:hypothetical protein
MECGILLRTDGTFQSQIFQPAEFWFAYSTKNFENPKVSSFCRAFERDLGREAGAGHPESDTFATTPLSVGPRCRYDRLHNCRGGCRPSTNPFPALQYL